MYDFLLNRWMTGYLTETQLNNAVLKGYITQAQADTIKATAKVG